MICPHCGGETPAPQGRCTLCGTPVPPQSRPQVAAGVLTPPAPTLRLDSDPEATRLGGPSAVGFGGADAPADPGEREITGVGGQADASADETRLSGTDLHGRASQGGGVAQGPASHAGATGTRASGPLVPGQDFGARYHIIRVLGVGGMGAVYQAWDQALEVAVALKIIRPEATDDPQAARDLERRFKRELLLARQVTHKNVVRIHDLGEIHGIKYITMPYMHGSDLATILRRDGKLPVPRALRIARQIVSGLVAAHQAGVVHRDLKPANIMIDAEDNACIMDFGIARSVTGTGTGITMAGAIVGTVEYMAPEQARGQAVDHRADIYAFGLIFYDMLVRRRQASATDSAVAELMGRMQQAPQSLRSIDQEIPEALDRLIATCLDPDPSKRSQTTEELAAALALLDADGHPLQSVTQAVSATAIRAAAPAATPAQIPAPAVRRLATTWKVPAAIAVLVLLALAGWMAKDRIFPKASPTEVAPSESVSLAILPFRNASGDQTLDWIGTSLAEILRSEMGQSAYLHTVSSDRLHQVLRDLKIGSNSTFDPATLRRLAEFSNAQTVMWGQYLKFGSEIRIDATLEDLRRQRTIPLKAQAPSEAGLLGAVEQLAQAVRESLAESPDILKELQAKSLKPSSKSFEALRYYNEGLQLARQGNHLEAVKRFQAATQEDPDFALAHSKLGQTYATLGYDNEAEQASRTAVDLSDRLPPQERYLVLANQARITNDTSKAIEYYQNLAKVSPDDSGIHFDLAGLYEGAGSLDLARDHFAKVLERDPKFVDALFAMGRVEIKRTNPQGSLDYLNRGLGLAIQLENDEAKANILNAIGIAYKRLDKPEEALRYYRESLEIKRRLGQKGGMAASLSEVAQVQDRLGKQDEALKSYNEALQLRRGIGDKRGIGISLIDMGAHYQNRGRYDQALTLMKEALQIQREVGNENYQALCLNNIGGIYSSKGQYDDAVTYFERALQLREKAKIPVEIAETLHNLAETSSKMGRYDEALARYLRALELLRGAGNKRTAAIESYSVGTIFEYQGRFGAAVKSKEEAVKAFRELQDRSFWQAEILSGYGSALAQAGRSDDARKNLDEALTLSRELQNHVLVAQTLNFQGDLSFYRGDLKSARGLYEQALQTASKTTDRYLVLVSKVNLAKIAVKERRSQSAAASLASLAQEADATGFRYLSLECAIYRAEALIELRDYARARPELERALGRSESQGLRLLQARSHYLLATTLRLTGSEPDARRRYSQALRLLDEIRKDTGSDDVLERSDLRIIREESTRWSKAA